MGVDVEVNSGKAVIFEWLKKTRDWICWLGVAATWLQCLGNAPGKAMEAPVIHTISMARKGELSLTSCEENAQSIFVTLVLLHFP